MIELPQIIVGAGALLTAFVISAGLTPLVRSWSRRRGFVDHPAGREKHKTHTTPTPFGGGIAIICGALFPVVVAIVVATLIGKVNPTSIPWLTRLLPEWPAWLGGVLLKSKEGLAIIGGAAVLHIMGLVDDHRPLSAVFKLIVQLAVALILTAGFGIRAGEMFGVVPSVIATTLWIVMLTNAFNFMDNMDGLSAGTAAITALVLALAAMLAGQVFVPSMILLVAGAVLGFLVYNFPPASIFMGDAGSLVIGYLLAIGAVLTTYYDPEMARTPFGVFLPLVVFAIPLYDIISVVIQRYRTGQSIFRSDCRHFSHRLVKLGLSRRMAVLTIYLAILATSLPGIILPDANWLMAVLIFGQCLCVVAIIAILETRHEAS